MHPTPPEDANGDTAQIHALDRAVANAATAWLTEPRDTLAYTHLVQAVERRRAFLSPPLPGTTPAHHHNASPQEPPPVPVGPNGAASNTETTDVVGSDRAPVRVGDVFSDDPQVTMNRLRHSTP